MPLLNGGQTARLEQLGGLRTTKHSLKQGGSTLQGDATFLNAKLQTFQAREGQQPIAGVPGRPGRIEATSAEEDQVMLE